MTCIVISESFTCKYQNWYHYFKKFLKQEHTYLNVDLTSHQSKITVVQNIQPETDAETWKTREYDTRMSSAASIAREIRLIQEDATLRALCNRF